MLASAASRSRPDSSSMTETICSKAARLSSGRRTACSMMGSLSMSLVAAKRTGRPAALALFSTRWAAAWMHRWTAPRGSFWLGLSGQKSMRLGASR